VEPAHAQLEGIYLGPIVPCWVNDDILKLLVDSYDIKLVSTLDADIQTMLA
jgi:hydroxylamine reductase